MSVTATCGHILTEEEGLGTTIPIKDFTKEGDPAVSYPTLCNKCLRYYRSERMELPTEESRQEWLNSKSSIADYSKVVLNSPIPKK